MDTLFAKPKNSFNSNSELFFIFFLFIISIFYSIYLLIFPLALSYFFITEKVYIKVYIFQGNIFFEYKYLFRKKKCIDYKIDEIKIQKYTRYQNRGKRYFAISFYKMGKLIEDLDEEQFLREEMELFLGNFNDVTDLGKK